MKGRFEGWYYKHQIEDHSLAIIPGRADGEAFVQVITEDQAYNIAYPLSEYQKGHNLRVGCCTFSKTGISLNIQSRELTLTGKIQYGKLTPISGDIMGPFRFFPMECRHEIISMGHDLFGSVQMNGKSIDFSGGTGYIEGDSGCSFPESYAWVQCVDKMLNYSIMASIALIPFYGLRFWGCICVVRIGEQEYRLATYNRAKIICCKQGLIEILQGKYRLRITVDTRDGYALKAPKHGEMNRIIRENLSCTAKFRLTENGRVLLDSKSRYASYEYAMQ